MSRIKFDNYKNLFISFMSIVVYDATGNWIWLVCAVLWVFIFISHAYIDHQREEFLKNIQVDLPPEVIEQIKELAEQTGEKIRGIAIKVSGKNCGDPHCKLHNPLTANENEHEK